MTTGDQNPETKPLSDASGSQQPVTDVPLNRAQRRALASGSKGGNKPSAPHQLNPHGPSGARPSVPPAQGRIQSRGANRGK